MHAVMLEYIFAQYVIQ